MRFFDFGDELDSALNVQKEIDRFLIIDKQLFGLYNVFGNGVIDGWLVKDNGFTPETGISVQIDPGIGVIGFLASETTFPETIEGLQPNSNLNIFAVLQGQTARDRFVDFTATTGTLSDDFAIKIAEVQTGDNSVTLINNDARQRISFKQIIKEEIDAHKHRGSPSKIDLAEETKNQLPGARIADIDASKISTGTFPVEQIPILDHEDLSNSGLLTHPQLDSFVQSLSRSNKELLGEVASTNLLRQIIFLKHLFPEVDEHFINELAIIPGISPDAFIDFEASTANINLLQRCISGVPPSSGEFLSVNFDNSTAFKNFHSLEDLEVVGEQIILKKDQGTIDVIENFEGIGGGGLNVPGFELETVVVNDDLTVISEDADTLKTQGFFSGRFSSERSFRAIFRKAFDEDRDWSIFDELIINVKTLSESHGAVFAQFKDSSGDSDIFLLLAENELTINEDEEFNNFVQKIFDIKDQARGSVSEFIIFTDDTDSGFEFFLDNIHVRNESQFKSQGITRIRFTSGSPVTFHSVFYDVDIPDGTDVIVRVKAASDESLLERSSFTMPLASGQVFALSGTDIEVEITLISDEDLTLTPTINSVELRLLATADFNGFEIDEKEEWELGTSQNIEITDEALGTSRLTLEDPINVGGTSFTLVDAVREIDDNNIGVFGFSGNNMPVSPVQAINWLDNPFKKFEQPVSVVRKFDKTFIVADMNNDRVLRVDKEGKLIKGFGGIGASDKTLYPFSSVYNPTINILTIVTSRPVDRSAIDLSKITLFIGSAEVPLGNSDELVDSKKSGQIVEISLSTDKKAALSSQTETGNVFVSISSGAFAEEIDFNENAAALSGVRGIETFIGDFTYIDEIRHPIFVDILDNDNWIIANSSVFFGDLPIEGEEDSAIANQNIPSLIELNPSSVEVDFSSDKVNFSDFSLGSVFEQTDNRLIIAGIVEDGNAVGEGTTSEASSEEGQATDEDDTTSDAEPSQDEDSTQEATEDETEESSETEEESSDIANLTESEIFRAEARDKLANFRGTVVIVEKTSGSVVFRYMSPDGLYASDIDVDEDGNLVIAESSFAAPAGRVIKLDNFGNIIRLFGKGTFAVVNDAKALEMDKLIISI